MSLRNRIASWVLAIVAISIVTTTGTLVGLNPSTVGFAYLFVVLLISVWGGLLVGTVSSVIATRCRKQFRARVALHGDDSWLRPLPRSTLFFPSARRARER